MRIPFLLAAFGFEADDWADVDGLPPGLLPWLF